MNMKHKSTQGGENRNSDVNFKKVYYDKMYKTGYVSIAHYNKLSYFGRRLKNVKWLMHHQHGPLSYRRHNDETRMMETI